MANAIALAQGVHSALDDGTSILVPKHGHRVALFLDPLYDLGPEHHDSPFKILPAVSEAFALVNLVLAELA